MVDIHAHILPGVDDGAKDLEESLKIARKMEEVGVKKVIATPHYLEEGYQLSPGETEEKVRELQRVIDKEGMELEVLPGAEVFITPVLGRDVSQGMVPTLNNSRYLLLEFPMDKIPSFTNHVLYDLRVMGIHPIISHPERYPVLMDNIKLLYEWMEEGVLAQVNSGSFLGVFGRKAQRAAKNLVLNNLVQFIGSDVHSGKSGRGYLTEGVGAIRRMIGNRANSFLKNAERVVYDKEIQFHVPKFDVSKTNVFALARKNLF